jgi:hypothetical protein
VAHFFLTLLGAFVDLLPSLLSIDVRSRRRRQRGTEAEDVDE